MKVARTTLIASSTVMNGLIHASIIVLVDRSAHQAVLIVIRLFVDVEMTTMNVRIGSFSFFSTLYRGICFTDPPNRIIMIELTQAALLPVRLKT